MTTAMKKNYIKPALKSIVVELHPFADMSIGQEENGTAETSTHRGGGSWGSLWGVED